MTAHHAYLLLGPKEEAFSVACALHNIAVSDTTHDPDIHVVTYVVCGIDDAKFLQRHAYQRPLARAYRLFIVQCESITREAQNALLKIFEEPPQSASFVVMLPTDHDILPTLKSRFSVQHVAGTDSRTVGIAFLRKSIKERLEEIAIRHERKDTEWYHELLKSVAHELRARGVVAPLADIVLAERHLRKRGASPKMILEHVALSLPVH